MKTGVAESLTVGAESRILLSEYKSAWLPRKFLRPAGWPHTDVGTPSNGFDTDISAYSAAQASFSICFQGDSTPQVFP